MDGSLSVEQRDDVSDPLHELWEKAPGWLIDEPNGRLIERYLGGHIAIALRHKAACSRETIQDGFVFQYPIGLR